MRLSITSVNPLGTLVFLLVLLDYLSAHPSPNSLFYQLWYFDDGALVVSRITT